MYRHLGTLNFSTVLDAFGGTGSVSLLFKAMRKQVTYHDGFRFNADVARTVLADKPSLDRGTVETILARIEPTVGVISNRFSGIFFKDCENNWLDGFARRLANEPMTEDAQSLLRYLVYQACLKKRPFNLFHRANLKLRTNEGVERSFGNAVTWERPFLQHALQAFDELSEGPRLVGGRVSILAAGDAGDIPAGYDLVYVDPPYINRQDKYNRDDYWRRYHFLEGLARYDEWDEKIDADSPIGLASTPEWFTDWGRARIFKDRLFAFIERHKHSHVALSYVSGAIPSEEEIKAHFENHFSQVSVHSARHSHVLSKTPKRELLFIGYPK
jgi:adenine-specific DNA-methyltransferase